MDLVGVKEAGEILGWDRRKISVYYSRGKLPAPVAHLAAGPIWHRQDIEAFARRGRGAAVATQQSKNKAPEAPMASGVYSGEKAPGSRREAVRPIPPGIDRLWTGAFWHHLLYANISPSGMDDFGGAFERALRRIFNNNYPDFAVAARIDGLDNLKTPARRTMVAKLLRLLHRHLGRQERKLLTFAHEGFLYFCGFCGSDGQVPDLAERLRFIATRLREEEGVLVTFGLCRRTAVAPEAKPELGFGNCARYAVVALRLQLNREKGQVHIYNESARDDSGVIPAKLVDWLRQVVQNGRLDRVPGISAELSDYLFGPIYIPLLKLRVLLQSLLVSMALAAQTAGVEELVLHSLNRKYLTLLMSSYDYTQLRQALLEAVTAFTGEVVKVRLQLREHPAVQAAEDYIHQHIDEPLSLKVIAGAVGLSSSYLSRLFRTYRGTTITNYINHERVEAAKNLLNDPDLSVAEVAFATGFGSLQHFNRMFRATLGCTPTQYRNQKYVQNG
ncbi:MAG TPA: helix-turn-helix transcriptional regulator [Firmicutes bacterium]|nr:helix-turn-helix transcriptional regulator [Bacillota bacterium]